MPHFGHTEIFQLIAGHLASLARHHEYGLVWGGSTLPQLDADTRLEHGEELCQQFIENRVDGKKIGGAIGQSASAPRSYLDLTVATSGRTATLSAAPGS